MTDFIYRKPNDIYGNLFANVNVPTLKTPEDSTANIFGENPYSRWAKPFINDMKVGDFVQLAGTLASAIAPNEWSGRAGAGLANMASKGQQGYNEFENEKLKWKLGEPERQMQQLYKQSLIENMENARADRLENLREKKRLDEEKLAEKANRPFYAQAMLDKLNEGNIPEAISYMSGAGDIGEKLLGIYTKKTEAEAKKQAEQERQTASLSYLQKAKEAYDKGDLVSASYYMGAAGNAGNKLSSMLKDASKASKQGTSGKKASGTTDTEKIDKTDKAIHKARVLNAYKVIDRMPIDAETKSSALEYLTNNIANNPNANPDKFVQSIMKRVPMEKGLLDKAREYMTPILGKPQEQTRPQTPEELRKTLDKIATGEIDIYNKRTPQAPQTPQTPQAPQAPQASQAPKKTVISNEANLRARAIAQLKADGKPINEKYIRYVMERLK